MTNKEKFKSIFGYDGSVLNDILPEDSANGIGTCGYMYSCTESCAARYTPRCPRWWNDEYPIQFEVQEYGNLNYG